MATAIHEGDLLVIMKRQRLTFPPFAAFAVLLLAPASGFAASILGSAGDFTLFGGTAISKTGADGAVIRNGNIGLSPAATTNISGFSPPGVILQNSAIIPTGPVTAQARQDLIKAQVGLAGMAPNAYMSNVDLGGKTLAPGVYKFNTTAGLTGDLVLDGQGKNNVFWVFQIGTGLTTAANATVTVINPGSNGGRDYGIFWNCGTAVTFGATNQIAGNYLAGTSISLGADRGSGGGRALALAAVTVDGVGQVDAFGGINGSDWTGGVIFDQAGKVVPYQPLWFRHFGKNHRTTTTFLRVIKGKASPSATVIQWRINANRWHSVAVRSNGTWKVTGSNYHTAHTVMRLRARDAAGARTKVQRITVWRH